jgi:MEMO1 family protein
MVTSRQPAVAGLFYPADPAELRAQIHTFLNTKAETTAREVPKAIIVPHAGYPYSGPVAASAYACLQTARDRIQRVILLGPAHRVPFSGLAITQAMGFATPLGTVPVNQEALEPLLALPQVQASDRPHALEHSLEVQLPFLQEILGDFSLVPLVVGRASATEVKAVLDLLWGGDETLIIVSSDLSHYHDYVTAQRLDQATSQAIEALQPQTIGYEQACGCIPIQALLLTAWERGLSPLTLDLRNSGDTAGPCTQVVGYGAYAFQ